MWKTEFSRKANAVNNRLETLLTCDSREHETLYESMNYSLLAGGKRIRPVLFLMALDLLGIASEHFIDVGCAIECVHTYSLIHDDLPAMDNDDYRRGKLTNHKVYGAGMATLAGDALLTYAFEILSTETNLTPEVRIRLVELLAKAAGPAGMIGGQAQDIGSSGKRQTLEELREMDRCKTGQLLMVPCDMAAVIAEADNNTAQKLHDFGMHLGILFQITDDILDETGDPHITGKNSQQDEKLEKSTYVTELGLEKAREIAAGEAEKAIQQITGFGERANVLMELTRAILNRNK